jgi:hypothetical protein
MTGYSPRPPQRIASRRTTFITWATCQIVNILLTFYVLADTNPGSATASQVTDAHNVGSGAPVDVPLLHALVRGLDLCYEGPAFD